MNAPDPTDCPQTPTGEGAPAEQAEPHSVQEPLRCWPTAQPLTEQPDDFARLEAWLAFSPRRTVRISYERYESIQRWEVVLGRGDGFERHVYSHEMGVDGPFTAIAKAPGLAATIDAALEKAEEVNL